MTSSSSAPPPPKDFRWQTFFQHARDPIFLLNRRRQVLFVNRAWEQETGVALGEVRRRFCRRAPADADAVTSLLAALAPPPEAMRGLSAQVRRRVPGPRMRWWQIDFLPLAGSEGLLGVLGTIRPLPETTTANSALPERLLALADGHWGDYRLEALEGDNPVLGRLVEQARLAARLAQPVLLLGEAGTGKEWLARAIHRASGRRHSFFARLDCARLPAPAVEDFLFGPRRTVEAFGTVYLREPACLPKDLQARLAEAGQNEEGVRLLAGMRLDPAEALRSGQLLETLYCRLSTLTLTLPALRDRKEELPRLVEIMARRACSAADRPPLAVSARALQVLHAHAWPGNLRELHETLLTAVQRAKGEQIEPDDLPFYLRHGPVPSVQNLPLDALLEQAERRLIALALRLAQDNQTRAAELLQVWRPRLLRRMKHLGLAGPGEAEPTGEEPS